MSFTQACFIRKDTIELRERLTKLGYRFSTYASENRCIATSTSSIDDNGEASVISRRPTAAIISEHMFDDNNPHTTWNCAGRIDCGTNEKMFLALSALRDDSDRHQWMIVTGANETYWVKSSVNRFTLNAGLFT